MWTDPPLCVDHVCAADCNALSWPCVFSVPQGASPCAVVAVTSAEVGGCGYESCWDRGVASSKRDAGHARRSVASVRVPVWLTISGQAVSSVAESVMLATLAKSVKISPRLNNHIRLSLLTLLHNLLANGILNLFVEAHFLNFKTFDQWLDSNFNCFNSAICFKILTLHLAWILKP